VSEWTSTTTPHELARWLGDGARIVVVTHTKPDGDAVGSSIALARALNTASGTRRAEVWYSGGTPPWLHEIARETPHRHVGTAEEPIPDIAPDRVVIVDTGSWSQLDAVAPFVRANHGRAAVIDHHLRGDTDTAARRLLDTAAAAVCEPLAEVCRLILGVERVAELHAPVATALYLGIATDTGWFRHSNVRPSTLRLAAELIEAGVDHAGLYALVEQSDRPARLRIIATALGSLEMIDRDRIAIVTLRTADIHAAHAGAQDTGGLTDFALRVASVRVSATITEVETGTHEPAAKISLRSKPGPGMVDVNAVAARLGGGGHANAAGARLDCSVEEARARLIKALTQ
jgi:phosphoesterase RecJ-like protein